MAIHEQDLFSTSADQPAWPDPDDDHEFTAGCPGCDATRAILSIEIELRLAVRDLWIAGWAPSDLVDEVRLRTGSLDARDLVVHALLDEDARRSEQAKTDEWTRSVALLAAAAAVEPVTTGWIALWVSGREDPDAASEVLLDVLDALVDLLRHAA